jgi:hypothetical protein
MSVKPMRVRVVLSLTVDTEAWRYEYGVESENVRQDVIDYIGNAVRSDLLDRGLLVSEES